MSVGFTIDFGEKGCWSPHDWGLHLLSREIGEPAKDDHTERVPFSSVTYDFDSICGMFGYGERSLAYQYELLSFGGWDARRQASHITADIRRKLRWRFRRRLLDDAHPDYYFEVREPIVKSAHPQNGVYVITVTFKANPAMLPLQIRPDLLLRLRDCRYPDVNGDGAVTAADASLILNAAEGKGSLTAEQKILADADRDGEITEADAVLVLEYASAVSAGQFADSPGSWYAYLNRFFALKEGVY